MRILILSIILHILTDKSTGSGMCTDPQLLRDSITLTATRLEGMVFQTFHSVGYFQCLRYCLIYSDCYSLNYRSLNGYCELNEEKDDLYNGTLVNQINFDFVVKSDIPKKLAGPCKDLVCGSSTSCEGDSSGLMYCHDRSRSNKAFGQVTNQSTEFASASTCCSSDHGVDGNTGGYLDFACAVTDYNDFEPWWEVQLNGMKTVTGIEIYSANDTEVGLIHNIGILVSKILPSQPIEEECCRFVKETLPRGKTKINCLRPVIGNRLKISMQKTQILLLCEVKVLTVDGYHKYGAKSLPTSCLKTYGTNFALDKPVLSSGIISGNSEWLVDGNRNMLDVNGAQCVSAGMDIILNTRWFAINLGVDKQIESVVIYNKATTNDIDTTLIDITIQVTQFSPFSITTCARHDGEFGSTSRIFDCDPILTGSSISISTTGPNLNLCEVEITTL